jgi:diacylglycerol kinase family enzyme
MPRKPGEIADWIEQGGSTEIDVAGLDGIPFLIMCNFGMDAGVIHRFESSRTKSGGFRNYILPVTAEVFNPRPASLIVSADDQPLHPVHSRSNLLIANMRSYALSLNPCNQADPTDGLLDVLETKCSSTPIWSMQGLLARCRLPILNARRTRAQHINIKGAVQPSLVQVDGEIARTPSMPEGILQPGQEISISIGQDHIRAVSAPKS